MPSDYDLIRSGASGMYAAFAAKIASSLRSRVSGVELTVHLGVYSALFYFHMTSELATVDALSAFTGLGSLQIKSILSILGDLGTIQSTSNGTGGAIQNYELVSNLDVLRDFLDRYDGLVGDS